MRFLSVCSGIEAASVAWAPLGWRAVAFSEIEPFPCAVLQHHYPHVPNWGDMTKFKEWPDATIDLLSGGTPCQSFSVAGLRKGLDDPRGNLMLTFGAIAERYRPRWLVWENVPGVVSSNGGRDFGTFLGMLGQLGYGFAYRVLDAQYFGVAQRRRRVFVVGYLGDWQPAAAVLFERHSLSGHPAPRREAGERPAPSLAARTRGGGGLGTDTELDGGLIASTGEISHCLNAGGMGRQDYETETLVAHTLRARMGGGTTGNHWDGQVVPVPHGGFEHGDLHPTLENTNPKQIALTAMQVRRLTPRECERLQGFPDDYTRIPWKHGYWPADKHTPEVCAAIAELCPDGPRYKALGNSWAVPCAAWIGTRINQVMEIIK